MYKFVENIVTHAGVKSYSDRSWKIWFYTKNGFLRGHTLSADLYQGLAVSNFFVNAQETATFDTVEQTPAVVEFEDVNDWDEEVVVLQPSFNMMDLEGVYDTILTVSSAANPGAELTVVITLALKGSNTALVGVLKAQLRLVDGSGNTITIDSAVESPNGTYTVVATTAVTTGTIRILDVITVGSNYYQSDTVTYTV